MYGQIYSVHGLNLLSVRNKYNQYTEYQCTEGKHNLPLLMRLQSDSRNELIDTLLDNDLTWAGERFDWDFTKFNTNKVKYSQNLREFDAWVSWIRKTMDLSKPVHYLEIGSYAGESLFYLAQVFPKGSVLTLVDLGDNQVARSILTRAIKFIELEYGHTVHLISGYSNDIRVLNQVKAFAPNGRYDLVFIDANHDFKWAFSDYLNYRDKAEWIAFHDISEFNIVKTTLKYGYEIANAAHVWKVLKSVIPKQVNLKFTHESERCDNWDEFVDYDNNTDMNIMNLKPRGIGVMRSEPY